MAVAAIPDVGAEMADAGLVAAAVCAGGTGAHSLLALRLLKEASQDEEAGQ